jgi:ComF family protein
MHTLLTVTIKALNNLIQPYYCAICYNRIPFQTQVPLCAHCGEKIEFNPPPFCQICGRSLDNHPEVKGVCRECLFAQRPKLRVYYVFKYKGAIREAIHKFKYQAELRLLPFFSSHLLNFYREHILPYHKIDYISYVPLYHGKFREREFNQAEILAKQLGRKTQLPMLKKLLIRIRYTRPQSELDKKERWRNVADAFKLNPKYIKILSGKTILLIDDLVTTSATLTECAHQLKKYNAKTIGFTLAGG